MKFNLIASMIKRFLLFCIVLLIINHPGIAQNNISPNKKLIPKAFLFTGEEVVDFAEEFGIDSALKKVSLLPIIKLDKIAAKKLVLIALDSPMNQHAEWYIVHYISITDTSGLNTEIIEKYISKKTKHCNNWDYRKIPDIDEYALKLLTLMNIPHKENLITDYYKASKKLADSLYTDFKTTGKKEAYYALIPTYESYHHNCYLALLALKEIDSDFYSEKKLEMHSKHIPLYLAKPKLNEKAHSAKQYRIMRIDSTKLEGRALSDFSYAIRSNKIISGFKQRIINDIIIFNENDAYVFISCTYGIVAASPIRLHIKKVGSYLYVYHER